MAFNKAESVVDNIRPEDLTPELSKRVNASGYEFSTDQQSVFKNQSNAIFKAVHYGEWLRSRAAFWAGNHAAIWPEDKRVRIDIANFANYAADYGNQISSRSDALMKQLMGVQGTFILRDQLSSSVYLRDSATTRYLNLYDWNEATVGRGDLGPTDRVRMVEQLVNDTHWARINTVFAAGQGDTHMAFIKDDIGNWNLKSFDSDPSDLLNTYKDLGSAALASATRLIRAGAGDVSQAQSLLGFADQVALGSDPEASALRGQINGHQQVLRDRLSGIADAHVNQLKAWDSELSGVDRALAAKETDVQSKQSEVNAKRAKLNELIATVQPPVTPVPAPAPAPSPSPVATPPPGPVPGASSSIQATKLVDEVVESEKQLAALEAEFAVLKASKSWLEAQRKQLPDVTKQRLRDAMEQYQRTLLALSVSAVSAPAPAPQKEGDAGSNEE